MKLFLCGDVMTGRGVDQILPHPCRPQIHEAYVQSALRYVELAEKVSGDIPRKVGPAYIWGESLNVLAKEQADFRIINLETSITHCEDWQAKGINYRMSPQNISALQTLAPDACALANNHTLDWGNKGLLDTLEFLRAAELAYVGAGHNLSEATRPLTLSLPNKRRLMVFSLGLLSSGIPPAWSAEADRPGVWFLASLSQDGLDEIKSRMDQWKKPGDTVLVSIHWGGNWGYEVPDTHRDFAHDLIDKVGVDLIHGHSSHHPKGIEIYKGKLILYGCGDFINDYEGIGGYEEFRPNLTLMYFASLGAEGDLTELKMAPMQVKKFQLQRTREEESQWLFASLKSHSDVAEMQWSLTGQQILLST